MKEPIQDKTARKALKCYEQVFGQQFTDDKEIAQIDDLAVRKLLADTGDGLIGFVFEETMTEKDHNDDETPVETAVRRLRKAAEDLTQTADLLERGG